MYAPITAVASRTSSPRFAFLLRVWPLHAEVAPDVVPSLREPMVGDWVSRGVMTRIAEVHDAATCSVPNSADKEPAPSPRT